jgi:hypothetical protein
MGERPIVPQTDPGFARIGEDAPDTALLKQLVVEKAEVKAKSMDPKMKVIKMIIAGRMKM